MLYINLEVVIKKRISLNKPLTNFGKPDCFALTDFSN